MYSSPFASLAAASLLVAGLVSADQPAWINSHKYDKVEFGKYPTQDFKTSNAVAPIVNLAKRHPSCQTDQYVFFAPRGYVGDARNAQATIMDQNGALIWTTNWPKSQLYNLMVQEWKGDKYLTFWAGNDAVGGHGAGKYYMFDNTYNLVRTMEAANGLDGDLHDFYFTDDGTVLMTVYQVVDHDLTKLNKTTGPIWDCLIQEVDLETEELVFEWRAADHLDVSDSYRGIGGEGEPGGAAYDWFHMNSIEKDPKGNYIVSSRYMHTVTYVQGKTGRVLWVLGGKQNMFKDLSGGRATNFGFQHHARWHNNYTEITLFDNNSDNAGGHPRGMRIKVDQEAMTAELVTEYRHPHDISAASQGSFQDLENGNVLLGWGFTGAWTEYSHDGRLLCDTHYGPMERFGSGDTQSYRVLKFDWQGFPTTNPDISVAQDDSGMWRAYVSWNGATEVRHWVLQGTNNTAAKNEDWEPVEKMVKHGFESSFMLRGGHHERLRIQGLDKTGFVLGTTDPADATVASIDYVLPPPNNKKELPLRLSLFAIGGVVVGLVLGLFSRPVWVTLATKIRERRRNTRYLPLAADDTDKRSGRAD